MGALKLIYDKLIAGEAFGTIIPHRLGGTMFWNNLYIEGNYIHWCHYGSSANKISLNNLKWILSEIFKMTPEQFLYNYTTFTKWYEINKCYDLKDIGQC